MVCNSGHSKPEAPCAAGQKSEELVFQLEDTRTVPISPLQPRLGAACPPVAPAKLLQALGAGTATHRLAQACECSPCGPAFEGLLEHRGDSLAQGQAPTA